MKVMLDPSIVAASTHGAALFGHGASADPDLTDASSHGAFTAVVRLVLPRPSSDYFSRGRGWYVPGSVRKAMERRFQPLMAMIPNVSLTTSSSLNCARTASYSSSDACV